VVLRPSIPRVAKRRPTSQLSVTTLEDRSVPALISGTAFYDTNADGIQEEGENPAPGVLVGLTANGSPDTCYSDGNGSLRFRRPARHLQCGFLSPGGLFYWHACRRL